ncbi:hypothetical protein [Paraburkholderia sp. GAS41]|uniref:hypothetical protein n=1 Tax=Paraburkholderia sp. GAS41 TaxID=3035134 RepID=UPI003D201B06
MGYIIKPAIRKLMGGSGAVDGTTVALKQAQNAGAFLDQQGAQAPTALAQLAQQAQAAQVARQAQATTQAAQATVQQGQIAAQAARQQAAQQFQAGTAQGLNAFQQAQAASQAARATAAQSPLAQGAAQRAAQAVAAQQAAAQVAQVNTLRAATRMPVGGGFQTLLQGGQSGLNLTSADANQGLRILANHPTLGPIANEMRASGGVQDPTQFYGLTNGLRGLKEQGVIGQTAAPAAAYSGSPALSEAMGAAAPAPAVIRNPASYSATVSRNQKMVDTAVQNAPTPQLAMVAHQLGGIASPETKQAVLDAVVKGASTPEHAQYAKDFLQPLVSYGK